MPVVGILFILFGVVLGPRLHVVAVLLLVIDVLVRVVRVRVYLLEDVAAAALPFVVEARLPVLPTVLLLVRLVYLVTLLVHHLPGGLQAAVCDLLLSKILFSFPHGLLLLFLHFQHLFLIL